MQTEPELYNKPMDTLLTSAQKSKITRAIYSNDYKSVISILDSVSTAHAGTAKMKDKKYVISEIVSSIEQAYKKASGSKFFSVGKKILKIKSDNAKEVGIQIIWRAYSYNKQVVENYLYKITDDKNWEVREYAAGALVAAINSYPEFYKTLKRWSKDSSENIRRGVVMAASGLRGTKKNNLNKAFTLLEPLLYDSSVYVKKNLGPFVLGVHFGHSYPEETLKRLEKWVKIKNENVRWNVAMSFNNSFGNKYPDEALKFLKILSADSSPVVQRAVKSTINHLKNRHKNINF